MKKYKRYYLAIFILVLFTALVFRDLSKSKFAVIKTSEAYAPVVNIDESEYSQTEKININMASVKLLTTINGIGEKLAERIVEYRQEHGNFETIQDIMKVNGIGEKLFNQIKSQIEL